MTPIAPSAKELIAMCAINQRIVKSIEHLPKNCESYSAVCQNLRATASVVYQPDCAGDMINVVRLLPRQQRY